MSNVQVPVVRYAVILPIALLCKARVRVISEKAQHGIQNMSKSESNRMFTGTASHL
jgi:hypothetical protein